MTDLAETLTERAKTHGDYTDRATTTQKLKDVVRAGRAYGDLHDHERETLDAIAVKIARIVSGNPHFHDHWHDIAGYATLSADRNRPAPLVELSTDVGGFMPWFGGAHAGDTKPAENRNIEAKLRNGVIRGGSAMFFNWDWNAPGQPPAHEIVGWRYMK